MAPREHTLLNLAYKLAAVSVNGKLSSLNSSFMGTSAVRPPAVSRGGHSCR